MKKIVAIVPIKSISKRLKKKNFRSVGGKPLYRHLLDKLNKTNFDEVYIDSDSAELENYCKSKGYQFIKRQKKLSKDNANGNDLLNYHSKIIDADYYFQLFVTAPLLSVESINDCIKLLDKKKNIDSILTIKEIYSWFWFKNKPVNYNPNLLPRSQDAIPIIQETNTPSLPWDTSFGNLYINDVEEQYLTLGQQFKSKTVRSDVYAKNVLIAPAEFKNVFNLMRQETQSLRCREILDIYCALKLVEDLEDYSVEINDLKNSKITTNVESNKSCESLEIFKQEITTLCIKYFKEFKKQLNTQDYKIPEKKTDWNELLLLNYSLRDAMIKFRLKDIKLIENYSLDTNEILCKDIRGFLISKDKSQLELPSSHVISKIDQGHGLVKKIGKLRNYKYMQDTYSAWIVKKIEEEGYYLPNNQKSTTSENISEI